MTVDQHPMLHPHTLYLILLQLPQVDLLLAQRVCKTWKTTIDRSNVLQTALFFRPESSTEHRGPVEVNELLLHHFRGLFLPESNDYGDLGPFELTRWHEEAASARPDTTRSRAYAREEASWRRMLLSRPATERLQFSFESSGMMGTAGKYRTLVFDGNDHTSPDAPFPQLTFGLMYDLMRDLATRTQFGATARSTMVIVGVPDDAYHGGDDDIISRQRDIAASIEELKERYTGAFPDFATPGSVLLRFSGAVSCCVDSPEVDVWADDYLQSKGSIDLDGIEWKAKVDYMDMYD